MRVNIRAIRIETFLLLGFFVLTLMDSQILRDVGIGFPSGSRHAFLILFLPFIIYINNISLVMPKSMLLPLLAALFYSLLLLVFSSMQPINSLVGFIFTFLFILVFIFSYSISISRSSVYTFLKLLSFSIFFMSLPSFIHGLIFGDLRGTPTIFRELGAYGFMMNIGIISSLFCYRESRRAIFLYLAFALVIFIFTTTLKKSILEAFFIFFLYIFFIENIKFSHKLILVSIFSILIIPLIAVLGSSIMENIAFNILYFQNTGVEEHVRFGMYLASANIAIDNFPFGSGFGTFGSFGSIFGGFYSPIYYEYGVSAIGMNSFEDVLNRNHTLLDTFWPHIIAELGIFGLFLYILLFFYPVYFSLKHRSHNLKHFSFVIVSLITITALDGLALYTPEIPIFIFIVFLISGLLCKGLVQLK